MAEENIFSCIPKRETKAKQFQNKDNTFLEDPTGHVGYILYSALHWRGTWEKTAKVTIYEDKHFNIQVTF